MRNWLSKRVNVLLFTWVVLTVLLLINNSFFRINEYIANPQHGIVEKLQFEKVSNFILESEKMPYYNLYFLLDAVWALFLLLLIGNIIKDTRKENVFQANSKRITVYTFYTVFASFAYFFDLIEGYLYLSIQWSIAAAASYIDLIVQVKVIFYALSLLCFVYWALKRFLIPNIRDLLRFLETSSLSLLFIGIIYALVTLMPQGGTLVVELFYKSGNIIVLFALLTFLALIVSHFPVYLDIWRYGNNKSVKLKMPKRKYRFLGFDIIYYIPMYEDKVETARYNRPLIFKMRRSLGILLYVAIFSIMLGVAFRFFEVNANAAVISLVVLILTLVIYNAYGKKYDRWNDDLYSGSASKVKKTIAQIVTYVGWFPHYFVLCTLLVFITFWVAAVIQWNRFTVLLFLLTLGCQMFLYIYFKICRGYLRYVFFTPELKTNRPDLFDDDILDAFKDYFKSNPRKTNIFLRFVATLSDNIQYLHLMRFAGILSLLTLIVANFSFVVASWLNPLNVILLYIILFYSLLIITFKHILYYHRVPSAGKVKYRRSFKYGVPSVIIILIFALSYLSRLPNDLHKLSIVKMKSQIIGYEEYLDEMTSDWQDRKQNYFFVGSYGGGLKANLWNLLLVNELEKRSKEQFLQRTLVLSGVSGGAVGVGNYAALLLNSEDTLEIKKRIDSIGRSNVLSNEITYLLGADWLREYMPFFKHNGRDRSYYSMKHHARFTGMDKENQVYNKRGYSDYWQNIYHNRGNKFPALIINTTSVDGSQGVASSVNFPIDAVPGARRIDLFEKEGTVNTVSTSNLSAVQNLFKDSTLTYFGVISTTNRFPFFSPTAKIEGKGSYLDGGYFENSGMLSAAEIYDAVAGDPSKKYHEKINPVFVNIINSEAYYIREKVTEWGFKPVKANDTGEISAIIGTLTSIDKLTGYMHGKMKARGFVVERIMMPHKISYAKVKGVLNADVDDPLRLMDLIKEHNGKIDTALKNSNSYNYGKWGVIEPPMARLLGEPAVEYQKAMVGYHPEIKNAIERIVNGYLISEENVTNVDQESYIVKQLDDKSLINGTPKEKVKKEPDSLKTVEN